MGPLRHAKMLERQGYGVLVYDARGLGRSEGTPNSYGWDRDKDIDAALAYLKPRDDVDPSRIGALGLSTGADMAIDAAGRRSDIAAVVADGTAAIGYHDIEEYSSKTLDRTPMWPPVQDDGGHPRRLGPEGLARRPARPVGCPAPARRRRQGGEGVGRALRQGRRRRSANPGTCPRRPTLAR